MCRTRHSPDSKWSWFAAICASFYVATSVGFFMSFGVLLAELMNEFGHGREETGKREVIGFCLPISQFLDNTSVLRNHSLHKI